MRKLATLFLVIVMVMSIITIPSFAEETTVQQADVQATVKNIIEVDGLQFKDLNSNGTLDVYEDWREDIEDRITDLYSQMTVEEKCYLLFHVCTCGDSSGIDFSDSRYLWEENCPFDVPAEGEEVSGPMTGGSYSMWYYINVYGITHFLDNSNGTPQQQIEYHNAIQEIGEGTRLGIPITISSDREYNTWGGMIDTPHDAFGTANNVELAQQLWQAYSEQTRAVGYHILLHPYGMELGSWNGEDPEYAGEMSKAEIAAIQSEDGAFACAKHFIARGGDASFSNARSIAQTVDNWMEAWATALEANPKWIMTNGYSTGLSNTVHVDYDAETMNYLRNTLGFDGVILSDWGAQGADNSSGITADGINLDEFTIAERYAFTINLGLDQIGSPGTDFDVENPGYYSSLNDMVEAVQTGLITEERLEQSCRRILRTKFELGLFENPYSDPAYALELAASDEYIAEQWEITDTDTLTAARNPELVELENQLMAESTVLVKNDDNLLPLAAETKVYITSSSEATTAGYAQNIMQFGTIVDTMEEADVVIGDFSRIDDVAEMFIDDAAASGKKVIISLNNTDPTAYIVENADAVLFVNFSRTADHGTGAGGYNTSIDYKVFAELLFGVREPAGMIVKEIARDTAMNESQWKDLAGDQGASDYVRLMLLATMKTSENNTTPNNWGDPLLCYQYGMRYGEDPDFVYDTLIVPTVLEEVVTETSMGASTSTQIMNQIKAGESFTVYTLLWNNGEDGMTTVNAYDGDMLIAQKTMAISGGSWRVVQMELTLNTVGEHTITVGTLSATINVVE